MFWRQKAERKGIHCVCRSCVADIACSVNCAQRFFLFSYLDFRFYFACCPPESFKIICFTCIWSKFVDTSLYSSQNPQQNPCRISPFSKNRGVKLITHRGLGLAKSILCAKFGGIRRSNAKFCEFFSVNPWFWAKIRNFSQVCFSLKKA